MENQPAGPPRLWILSTAEGRRLARGNPEVLKAAGFKDDPSKGDKEPLRLELEFVPGWAPGRSMKPPQPAVMKLAGS